MKVHSLIRKGFGFGIVEVEVSLLPGLPVMQVIGLPDTMIKESVYRIRAALNRQGFKMPLSQQILVNLKPAHVKKTSQGLDLAIAAALLWETEQIPAPLTDGIPLLYGELSLTGLVTAPDDLQNFIPGEDSRPLVTGQSKNAFAFTTVEIQELRDFLNYENTLLEACAIQMIRPNLPKIKVGQKLARLLSVVAAGEHSTIFAGPAGSGKTTMADCIFTLLRDPEQNIFQLSRQISKRFGIQISWRPKVSPHHMTPALSLVGGGDPPRSGEITRAHGGVLILDEYLEFDSEVQEALREPLDSNQITISRRSEVAVYPCQFLLLATTNLCKCGQYVPKIGNRCSCSEKRRRAYLERFSGPMIDRFSVFAFSNEWVFEKREVSFEKIFNEIQMAWKFAKKARGQTLSNSVMDAKDIEKTLGKFAKLEDLLGGHTSERRRYHLLRVARTLADLDQKSEISMAHLQESSNLTLVPLQQLREAPFARIYEDPKPKQVD